jgi:RNA polymerase sigma-70 factor (ECF subfamily)
MRVNHVLARVVRQAEGVAPALGSEHHRRDAGAGVSLDGFDPPETMALTTAVGRGAEHAGEAQSQEAGRIRHADRVVEELDAVAGQALLGLALRSGLRHEAAEDAVQEGLLRLWLEIRGGVEIIDPRAWAFTAVYRIAMDDHRIRRKAGDIIARLSMRATRSLDPDAAQIISVWQLVDRLPTRQRQVLYLRYKADMSFEQVAAVMGIAPSTARAHAAFATERLRLTIDPTWEP